MVVVKVDGDEASSVGMRQLPHVCRQAIAIVWAAAPRDAVLTIALQFVGALGLVGLLLIGQAALETLLRELDRGTSVGAVLPWVVAIAAVTGAQALAGAVQRERQFILSDEVSRYVEGRVLDVTTAVDLATFDSPEFHNRLQRSGFGGFKMSLVMVDSVFDLVRSALGIVAGLAVVVAVAPVMLPLLLLAALPAWFAASRRGEEFHQFFFKLAHDDRQRFYLARLLQNRNSAKEVRAFTLAAHLRRRYETLYDERMVRLRRLANRQIVINLGATTAMGLILGGTLLLMAWLALSGRVPLASAGIAVVGAAVVAGRLSSVGGALGGLTGTARHLDDYLAFEAMLPRVRAARPTGPAPAGFTELTAQGVGFRYPTATEPALQDVSVRVTAGEVVALVGENGSGKTTLAKLLAGLYLPDAGTVRWDGVDMSTVDPDAWRDRVAVIFQDFERFQLTARENVGLGRIAAIDDEAAIRDAARHSGADSFITGLPDGYDTMLGPEFVKGTDLSVGQWQRIALARAFFRGAPVVILDEPTAALDPRAEKELFDRIRTLLTGRTVLLISHRFSSVRSADRIYVLDAGRVVESGDHEELMTLGGLYAELFTLQAAAYVD